MPYLQRCRACPPWPASTPRSTPPFRGPPRPTRSRPAGASAVRFAAIAFTVSRMAGSPGAALEQGSGLKGLAGSPDMRGVLERAGEGDARARLALDVYQHRLRAGIAAMAAALGGLDALVFAGGVGERAPTVRGDAVRGL